MEQLDLLSPPRTRRGDPASSRLAANRVRESGGHQTQGEIVLELVRRYPNRTSAELAALSRRVHDLPDLDRYQVARRLSDLRDRQPPSPALVKNPAGPDGKPVTRQCRIKKSPAILWVPAEVSK